MVNSLVLVVVVDLAVDHQKMEQDLEVLALQDRVIMEVVK
jgi:hypothetical protein